MRLIILLAFILSGCTSVPEDFTPKSEKQIKTSAEKKNEAFKKGNIGPGAANIGKRGEDADWKNN